MRKSTIASEIVIDFGRSSPAFQQIARSIESLVRSAKLLPGTKLPTVRELAADLGVPPASVQRALRELTRTGITVTQGTAGTFVRSDAAIAAASDDGVRRYARQVIDDADRFNFDRKTLARLISPETTLETQP